MTSNTRELVDSNFNQLSFIQALGAEALVKGVGNAVPYENGLYGRGGWPSPPIIEKIMKNFFGSDFGENFSLLLKKKNATVFFSCF